MHSGDTNKARMASAPPSAAEKQPYLPSPRAALLVGGLTLLALGAALFLRYGIIQSTPIGLACEAGEQSLTCSVRLAVILLFIRSVFGWTALCASLVQLLRPNVVALSLGLVSAAFGLVLYNTRMSALAVALIALSFARRVPARR
jgi:hypothetical protein